jgi:hypothetical protein
METYIPHRPFTVHATFEKDRHTALNSLDLSAIDPPLRPLVNSLNTHPQIFSLQCCHGHFVTEGGSELINLGGGRAGDSLIYRLAYLAVCIADNEPGRQFRTLLMDLPARVDPENVQFGSSTWFWDQWPNSYVVQVMPERYKELDKAKLGYAEALKLGRIRDAFFTALKEIYPG